MLRRRTITLLCTSAMLALPLAAIPPAHASEIIVRNASNPALTVDDQGRAVVHYNRAGRRHHVVAWGAVNAVAPSQGAYQVRFRKDYTGGSAAFKSPVWKSIRGCGTYSGPQLPWFVTGCTAADGSHWALQRWQRMLPNYGVAPWKPSQKVWELHLSHWSGDLPKLEIWLDWVYSGRFHHLFGRYTYLGEPVHGFRSTSTGAPLDTWGRNIYLDSWNAPAYGAGWKQENSFLAHLPHGNFCYGFYPHTAPTGAGPVRRAAGNGAYYRASVMGPGVTPIVMWHGPGLPNFNAGDQYHTYYEAQMNSWGDQVRGSDRNCGQH